jgi:hypothetical protein
VCTNALDIVHNVLHFEEVNRRSASLLLLCPDIGCISVCISWDAKPMPNKRPDSEEKVLML